MVYFFNKPLAESRGLSEEDMKAMQKVYEFLYQILHRPSMHCQSPQEALAVLEGLEYTLQLFWKFPVDKNYHSYWFDLNGCSCPKVDNRERSGTSYKIITCDCPYHGDNRAETWDDKRFG